MLAMPVRCERQGDRRAAAASGPAAPAVSPASSSARTSALFQRFASMIAEGSFPFSGRVGRLQRGAACRRRRDGARRGGPRAVRLAERRVGAASCRHRRQRGRHAPGRAGLQRQPGSPGVREHACRSSRSSSRPPTSRCCAGCMPIARGRRGHRRRAVAARRHRGAQARPAAAVEGRHDPRDPPPGEEQPADDLVAAAPAGPPARTPRRPRPPWPRSVRRIRTIALVHETLSREPGDDVAFLEIVRPLLRLAEEGLQSPDRPVRFTVQGDGGRLPVDGRHAACRWCSPSCCRTPSITGSRRAAAAATWWCMLDNDRASSCSIRVINDGRGLDPRLRAQQGDRSRPVDRAHAGDHRAGRHASSMRPGIPEDFAAVGLGDQPKGAGTVVDLTVPV